MKKYLKMAITLSFMFILTLSVVLLPKIFASSPEDHIKNILASGEITINTDQEITESNFFTIVRNYAGKNNGHFPVDSSGSAYKNVMLTASKCDYSAKACNFVLTVTSGGGTNTNESVEEYNNVKVVFNKDVGNQFANIVRDNKLIVNYDESLLFGDIAKESCIMNYVDTLSEYSDDGSIKYSYDSSSKTITRCEYSQGALINYTVKTVNEILFEYSETPYSDDFKAITSGTLAIKINGDVTEKILDFYFANYNNPELDFNRDGNIVNNRVGITMCKYKNHECENHIVTIEADQNIDTSVYDIFNFKDTIEVPAEESEDTKTYYSSMINPLDYRKENADGTFIEFYVMADRQTPENIYNIYMKRDKEGKLLDIQYRKVTIVYTGYSNTYSDEYKDRIGTEIVINSNIKTKQNIANFLMRKGSVLSCNADSSQCDVALFNQKKKIVEIHRLNVNFDTNIPQEFKDIANVKSDSSIDILADEDAKPSYFHYEYNLGNKGIISFDCSSDSTCEITLKNEVPYKYEKYDLKVNYIKASATSDYLDHIETNKDFYLGENTYFWNQLSMTKPFNKNKSDSTSYINCNYTAQTCYVIYFNSNNQLEMHKAKANFKKGTSKEFQANFPNNTMKLNAVYKDDEDYILNASGDYLKSKMLFTSRMSNYNNRSGKIIFNGTEHHTVNIDFVEGNTTHQNLVDGVLTKLENTKFNITIEDLEFINLFYYEKPNNQQQATLNFKKVFDIINDTIANKHISFSFIPKEGTGTTYQHLIAGKLLLYYDGIAYGNTKNLIYVNRNNVLYIPDDTKDDVASYVAAAQKRVDDYLGKDSGVVVRYNGEATEDEIELLGIDRNKTDGNNYQLVYNGHTEDFLIIKDSSKITKATPFTATDFTSNIKVSSDTATYPSDTVVSTKVLAQDNQESVDLLNKLKLSKGKVVDINLYSPTLGKIKDYQGAKFKVSIPLHDFDYQGKELAAYYVAEDGTVETYPVVMEDFIATFETTHFSKYTIGTKSSTLKGDLNNNGKIDLTDVLIELKIFFGNNPTQEQLAIGDMNSSGEINLTDVLLLLKEFFKA